MHQYTADLANRQLAAGEDVHLVSTSVLPRDRYSPGITIHTPIALTNTGFSPEGVRSLPHLRAVARAISGFRPDVVHITGPHLWNLLLMDRLRAAGVPVVHTLHDLHPHLGAVYGRLLYLWNSRVQRKADHLLVHGQRYRDELLANGVPASRVTCTLLTHLFVGHETALLLAQELPPIDYEPWALFIGRLERYKGLGVLVEAAQQARARVCIAGPGSLRSTLKRALRTLPDNVELRNRLIADSEAIDLFRRCGVVVLPYLEASQSALVAAAYFFRKPVIVSRAGALPEYVVEGDTGWIVPPHDAPALANALAMALADPARLAGMGHAGRAWLERQHRSDDQALHDMYTTARNSTQTSMQHAI
jgi:glycosyltransferase involved in cell wall biosynthesis